MKYCLDTWFILNAFERDPKCEQIIRETMSGKTQLFIPIVVFAEATKKLMQHGVRKQDIELFWQGAESSNKIHLINADRAIAAEAAKISLTFGVPLIDSFVAATCTIMKCDVLLSGDADYTILAKHKYLRVQQW